MLFTGIIEEIGVVKSIVSGADYCELTVSAGIVLDGTRTGDSIAVNGVCLTVTKMTADSFTADVMPETLRRSALGSLKNGSTVNLERAMAADGRFGGHIVSGHIDGTGKIVSMKREKNAVWVRIEADSSILRLIVEKGSIAIDGISLTVAEVNGKSFAVSIIPHTALKTTLLTKNTGDIVDLENDIIGKYVQRLMEPVEDNNKNKSVITEEFLSRYGFM